MEVPGIRARNRQAILTAIIDAAKEQLQLVGPDDLSLRAIARELGMASSAVYRYVSSRDELLTLLIIDGYNNLADDVQRKVARIREPGKRFRAIGLACREWALADPRTFALIYGSPVLGYAAPQDTIAPATRIPVMLVEVLVAGGPVPANPAFTARVARSLQPLNTAAEQWAAPHEIDEAGLALGLLAWTHIIGAISFELFGHRHNVVGSSPADRCTYFQFELDTLARLLGL